MIIQNDPTIIAFTKTGLPNGYLGNMFSSPIEYDGKVWKTAEALFQALRFDDDEIRELIRAERSPMFAKVRSRQHKDRMTVQPLSSRDLDNMRFVLRLKFDQHEELKRELLSTGTALLIEDVAARKNRGSATFWGASLEGDEWVGKNKLGELLMELRQSYSICN